MAIRLHQGITASSTSSSSTSSRQPSHHVFLSFRGEDTRNSFVSNLDKALRDKGIGAYLDSKDLPKGEQISPALLEAIEESMIAAIVFSENYAASTWCLEEVSHIMKCSRPEKQLMVVPIFYKVDPSCVRKQTGSFETAFLEHERKGTAPDKVQKWKEALEKAGHLSGFHIEGYKPEPEEIKEIVKDIINKLDSRVISQSAYREGLVGIGPKVEKIMSLLRIGEGGVRMIGIWGMGGIGKTTLAQVIFKEVSGQFESCHLQLNVKSKEIDAMRMEIFSTLLNEKILCPDRSFVMDRLRRKRVLVVLDDVNDFIKQVEELEINRANLGAGSRIIVTSRDKQILTNRHVDEVYEVEEINNDDSLQLFSKYAFNQNHPVGDDFKDLSHKFLGYAGGLPLALKILGAALIQKAEENLGQYMEYTEETSEQKNFRCIEDQL